MKLSECKEEALFENLCVTLLLNGSTPENQITELVHDIMDVINETKTTS